MGMSTHVAAFKPPGEKWRQMKAVFDACTAADIEVPPQVWGYFNDMPPDPAGVEIERSALLNCGALKEWNSDHAEGYEVDVTKLPKDVTVVRFYNSY